MLTVKIKECSGEYRAYVSSHRTSDKWQAIEKAITKHWGKNARLFVDNGLTTKETIYGQIGRYLKKYQAATMDTGRVLVTVS